MQDTRDSKAPASPRLVAGAQEMLAVLGPLAARRSTLLTAAAVVTGLQLGWGVWVSTEIMERSRSISWNFLLVVGQVLWMMLASVLLAGVWWTRGRHDASAGAFADRTAAGWAVLALSLGVQWMALSLLTDNYIDRYHRAGFFLTRLRSAEPEERLRGIRSLAEEINLSATTDADVRSLVAALATGDPDLEVRLWATWVCGYRTLPACVPGLHRALREEGMSDSTLRVETLLALARLRDFRVVDEAVDRLESLPADAWSGAEVHALLRVLGMLPVAGRTDAMIGWLPRTADDPHARAILIWALARLRSLAPREAALAAWDESADNPVQACLWAELLKHVTVVEDIPRLREAMHEAVRSDIRCASVVLEDRAPEVDRMHRDVLHAAEPLAIKYLKALFNIAGPGLQDDIGRILFDESLPMEVRLPAQDLWRLHERESRRAPRTLRGG
jgi:hypothetical protein